MFEENDMFEKNITGTLSSWDIRQTVQFAASPTFDSQKFLEIGTRITLNAVFT